MVCEKCEKKLKSVVTPSPYGMGGRSKDDKTDGRKINENKAITNRNNPLNCFRKCRICTQKIHQSGAYYCQSCAYKKGICSMCGKKVLSTGSYRQSST